MTEREAAFYAGLTPQSTVLLSKVTGLGTTRQQITRKVPWKRHGSSHEGLDCWDGIRDVWAVTSSLRGRVRDRPRQDEGFAGCGVLCGQFKASGALGLPRQEMVQYRTRMGN